jgi:hypothetical protein
VNDFDEFKNIHKKVYVDYIREAQALKNYAQNSIKCRLHNEKFLTGRSSYSCGTWMHFDLDLNSFIGNFTGYKKSILKNNKKRAATIMKKKKSFKSNFIPSSFNYTQQGYVTKVMYQGWCGCCW